MCMCVKIRVEFPGYGRGVHQNTDFVIRLEGKLGEVVRTDDDQVPVNGNDLLVMESASAFAFSKCSLPLPA